jgi:fatty-acid desaturase
MKKKITQLSIFGTMFLLPELLWSPVGNIIYEFLQKTNDVQPYRYNFFTNSDNSVYLSLILLVQFIGCLLILIYLVNHKKNNIFFWFGILLLIIITLVTFFIFYLSITLGVNGIGF